MKSLVSRRPIPGRLKTRIGLFRRPVLGHAGACASPSRIGPVAGFSSVGKNGSSCGYVILVWLAWC